MQRLWHGRGGGVDRAGEHPDDEHQHHWIAPQAPQLLDAQAIDVDEVADAGARAVHLNAPAS